MSNSYPASTVASTLASALAASRMLTLVDVLPRSAVTASVVEKTVADSSAYVEEASREASYITVVSGSEILIYRGLLTISTLRIHIARTKKAIMPNKILLIVFFFMKSPD